MAAPQTYLTLAGYTFAGFGVPERINGGGHQKLVVHKFLGGARVFDSLGPDDDPIEWKGTFRSLDGFDPVTQARFLDAVRFAGKPVTLTYWNYTYQVFISYFKWEFARFHEVDFHLICEVYVDPALQAPGPGLTLDGAVGGDLVLASTLAEGSVIATNELIAAAVAYSSYGPLANASPAGILSIAAGVTSAISGLSAIAAAADVSFGNPGGVVAGGILSVMAASLTAQAQTIIDGACAQAALSVMQRINLNISAPNNLVTV